MDARKLAPRATMALALVCTAIAIPILSSPPMNAALPPAVDIIRVKFEDPFEQAFTVEVPQGWTVRGGLFRLGYSDYRPMIDLVSPDGSINIHPFRRRSRSHLLSSHPNSSTRWRSHRSRRPSSGNLRQISHRQRLRRPLRADAFQNRLQNTNARTSGSSPARQKRFQRRPRIPAKFQRRNRLSLRFQRKIARRLRVRPHGSFLQSLASKSPHQLYRPRRSSPASPQHHHASLGNVSGEFEVGGISKADGRSRPSISSAAPTATPRRASPASAAIRSQNARHAQSSERLRASPSSPSRAGRILGQHANRPDANGRSAKQRNAPSPDRPKQRLLDQRARHSSEFKCLSRRRLPRITTAIIKFSAPRTQLHGKP